MKQYELRLALVQTIAGVVSAVVGVVGVIIAGIHLWFILTQSM